MLRDAAPSAALLNHGAPSDDGREHIVVAMCHTRHDTDPGELAASGVCLNS